MTDPRKADTLDEAARNPDGTYNGARALSWLSDVLLGVGKGIPEDEIKQMFADAKAERADVAVREGAGKSLEAIRLETRAPPPNSPRSNSNIKVGAIPKG